MKLLCRLGIHNWTEWKCTKFTSETGKPLRVKECKRCLTRRYRKLR